MNKQIEIQGQMVKLYSLDEGKSWSSSPQSVVAYGQRKQMLRRDLQKAFEQLVEIEDPDPNTVVELGIRMGSR
jgi:hypothetical protein